jgi:hypothetical protein
MSGGARTAPVDSPRARAQRIRMSDVATLVTIRAFTSLPEADAAASALRARGIDAELADSGTIGIDWMLSNVLGGIKLRVPADEAPEASRLLDAGMEADEAAEDACERCGSTDVQLRDTRKPWRALALLVGLIIVPRGHMLVHCRACGHESGIG